MKSIKLIIGMCLAIVEDRVIRSRGDFWSYETKEAADADRGEETVACIPFVVDCEEGEGL